jgi:hypothetical protein
MRLRAGSVKGHNWLPVGRVPSTCWEEGSAESFPSRHIPPSPPGARGATSFDEVDLPVARRDPFRDESEARPLNSINADYGRLTCASRSLLLEAYAAATSHARHLGEALHRRLPRRLETDDAAAPAVGEQIDHAVGALPDIADALAGIDHVTALGGDAAIGEPQAHEAAWAE